MGPVGDLAVVDGSWFDPVGVVLPVLHPLASTNLLAATSGLKIIEQLDLIQESRKESKVPYLKALNITIGAVAVDVGLVPLLVRHVARADAHSAPHGRRAIVLVVSLVAASGGRGSRNSGGCGGVRRRRVPLPLRAPQLLRLRPRGTLAGLRRRR